jgi:ketosteroid isomerase-like protein
VSEENVELVRRICEGWGRGDFASVDWADPEIVFRTPDGLEVRGREEMGRAWGEWLSTFDHFTSGAFEYFDSGDQVVTFNRFGGTAKNSGLPMEEIPGCSRFRIRDGRVVELELGTDRKRALRDAGIDPAAAD